MQGRISLIIPVKNEENSIRNLLDSLMGQTRSPEEIIIADGGSKDKTIEIIESYIKNGAPVKLIKTQHAYPGRGRNIAIAASSFEWIAMTDGGIKLDRHWLSELVRQIEERRDLDGVYGNYEPIIDSLFRECLATVFIPVPKLVNGKKMRSHFIASSLIKKDVWKTVGGFPNFRAAEDRIFMENVEKEGFRMGYSPGAKVFWDIPYNFETTFKRFSIFSMHDIKAGRFVDWHRSVLFMYLRGAIIVFLGAIVSPWWYLILFFSVFLRASNLIRHKLKGTSYSTLSYFKRLSLVTVIMIWIDIAMFWGMIMYMANKFQKKRKT